MTIKSPTFIESGWVEQRGTARNPWKVRTWIPERHEKFSEVVLQAAANVKRPSFRDRNDVVRTLRRFGIPGASTFSYRMSQAGHMITTTARGADIRKLVAIRGELHGRLVLDTLSKNATYVVQIMYPVFSNTKGFIDMILDLTRRMNNYAYTREQLGDTVTPIYFSGLHPKMGAYITVLGDPEPTVSLPEDDLGARPVFHRLVDAGIYPVSRAAVRKTRRNTYLVSSPSLLHDIPKGIHTAYKRYRRVEGPEQAWIAAGGPTWASVYSTFNLHLESNTPTTGRASNAAVTFDGTLMKHLSAVIQNVETGKKSRRPVDPHVEQILNTVTGSGKKLGQGAYGQVFGLFLNGETMQHLTTIQGALTNTIEFAALKPKTNIVLKVERLNPIRPLTVTEVRRLAGEAYIQQYVHTNSGIEKRVRHLAPVVAPGVYFSGTLANKYHLICMDYVKGVPLKSVISRGVISDGVYAAMELAVKTMLRNGVVHSDLHKNNVFVVKSGRSTRIKVLDFGFASIVHPRMQAKIVRVLDNTGSIDDAFRTTGLIESVNAAKIDYKYYHSNAKMMRLLKSMKNMGPRTGLRSHRVLFKKPESKGAASTGTIARVQRGLQKLKIGTSTSGRPSRASSRSVVSRGGGLGRSTPTGSSGRFAPTMYVTASRRRT